MFLGLIVRMLAEIRPDVSELTQRRDESWIRSEIKADPQKWQDVFVSERTPQASLTFEALCIAINNNNAYESDYAREYIDSHEQSFDIPLEGL